MVSDIGRWNCTQVMRPIKDVIVNCHILVLLHLQDQLGLTGKSLPLHVKEEMLNSQDALFDKKFEIRRALQLL